MVLAGLWLWLRPRAERSRAASLVPWSAPVLLSVGMLFLWLDLENKLNVFRFYFAFEPAAPMSWGSWILVAIYPVSIGLAWAATPADLRSGLLARLPAWLPWQDRLGRLGRWVVDRTRGFAVASVVSGAALGIYTGVLLGTMAARPLWNSAVLGPLFLVSGLSTGAAFMLLYRLEDDERRLLGRVDMGLILVELVVVGLWLTGLASGGAASQQAAALFLGGPYTAAFWTLVIALGLVAPLAAEWLEQRHGAVPGRAGALLVLAGGLALRWIIVYAGQHSAMLALH